MEERDDYPIIPQEPIFIPAGDRRVLLNGQPPFVPCRVVAEERYQLMKKELASLKEENALLKECFELSEQAKNHLRTKGYGWTGLDILKTCELVPFSDNK